MQTYYVSYKYTFENITSRSGNKGTIVTSTNFARNATIYAIFAAFGGFVFGLDAANLSGAIRFVSAQFGLDSIQTGNVGIAPLVGVIVALFFTGWLCEHFGRKKVLLAIAFTYALSSILSALAVNYHMLLVGRFIGGVAFASLTVSAMYIGEIAPADKRGKYVSVAQLLIGLGIMLAFIINYFLVKSLPTSSWLTETNVWRYMLGFELIANAVWIAMILNIPESPRWLLKKDREDEAREILARMQSQTVIDSELKGIKASLAEDPKTTAMQQLKILFSSKMNVAVMIAVVYAVAQGATGMNAVLFFAPIVFEQIGMSTELAYFQTIIFGVIGVICTIIAIALVEKLGRRFLTLVGLALVIMAHTSSWFGFKNATYDLSPSAITQIAEQGVDTSKLLQLSGKTYSSDVDLKADLATVYTKNELPLVSGAVINSTIDINPAFVLFGIFAFIAAFNVSIGPIMWVIFSEVFPTSVRSVALPFAALVQTIASFAVTKFFPWQLENFGSANTFLIFAVIGLIGLIILFFILPETKGKTIEEIERDLVKA